MAFRLPFLLALLIGWWLMGAVADAQVLPPNLQFSTATERDGLPANNVRCLLRDHQGFLWVGTSDGLARYDGTAFQVFRHRRGDRTSLCHNTVLTLGEDARGRIWIGTHGGVCCLDAARERFQVWHHDEADSTSLASDYDNRILVARTGTVWLANGAGLHRYDPVGDRWDRVPLPGDGGLLQAVFEDRAGLLWLGTNGLVRAYDPRAGRVVASLALPAPPGGLPTPVTGFFQDHRGQVWATTWGDGIVRLDRATATSRAFVWDQHPPTTGVANIVLGAAETRAADGRHTLWLATNLGLRRLDQPRPGAAWPADLVAAPLYHNDSRDPTALTGPDVNAVFTDPTGILWIGTAGGLSWLVPRRQAFGVLPLPVEGEHPQYVLPDRDPLTRRRQYWLTSWYGNGLSLYDSTLHFVRAWPRLPVGSAAFDAGQMSAVVRSRVDGMLWVATYDGLVRFDPRTGQTRLFRGTKTNTTSLRYYHATKLYEDRLGRLWIGVWRRGVYLLTDRVRGTFLHYGEAEGLPFQIVTAITEDAAGRLWIGGEGGLVRFDPAAPGGWRVYRYDAHNRHSLPHWAVNDLWPTPDGRLWVATNDGIGIWQPETDGFEQLTSQQGLPADYVNGIRTDRDGRLWFTTARGLVRTLGPRGPFQLFNQSTGLPRSDLDGRFDTLPDGRLFISLHGGLLLVNPRAYASNRVPPPVALTEVRLLDQPLHLGQPLDSVPLLDLKPTQNTLTFSYAALNYSNANRNRYYYRLDGVHDEWVAAGTRRYATFANLPGGDYTFRVRATNDDGVLSTREATFHFRIRRPFTRTRFFWGSLVLAALLAGRARVQAIRRAAERQNQLTREMADLEGRALRAQMNPHFVFNSLNAIQELVVTGRAEGASRYLTRFARLLRLVLEHSERTYVPLDAEITALQLYLDIESLRLEGLAWAFEIDPDLEDAQPRIPAMVLQPYLENALWHGLAARPPQARRLTVNLTFTPDEKAVQAVITDSGIGRTAAALRSAPRRHHSMGQRLTERRLQLLGAEIPPPQFDDLTDPVTGAPAGTRVTLWLGTEG